MSIHIRLNPRPGIVGFRPVLEINQAAWALPLSIEWQAHDDRKYWRLIIHFFIFRLHINRYRA